MKTMISEVRKSGVTRKMKFVEAVGNLVWDRYQKYLHTVGGKVNFVNEFIAGTRDDGDAAWGSREKFSDLMSIEGIHIELNGLKLDSSLNPVVSLYVDFDLGIEGSWEVCSYYVDLLPNGKVIVTDSLLLNASGCETKVHGNDLQWDCFTGYVESALVLRTENLSALAA